MTRKQILTEYANGRRNFQGHKLGGIDLSRCFLKGAGFRGANLRGGKPKQGRFGRGKSEKVGLDGI